MHGTTSLLTKENCIRIFRNFEIIKGPTSLTIYFASFKLITYTLFRAHQKGMLQKYSLEGIDKYNAHLTEVLQI
jgi:hypothetical protein